MAKQITRTFETHKVHGAKIEVVDGAVTMEELEPVEIFNQGVNQEKALKLLQKTYGKKNQYAVTSIETSKTTYGIDFDKFMELAVIIE